MPDTPLISLITIVFNGDRYLEDTIKSVLTQTYSNFEYIIIDGGSTDNTLNIIRKYEDHLGAWISEKDNGISDAFNKGIALAQGDLIGIINADDWYEPNALLNVAQAYVDDNTIICGHVKLYNTNSHYKIKQSTLKGIKSQMTIWHPGTFVPRKVYQKAGLYDVNIKVLMDYDWVLRCLRNNISFKFVDVTLSNMRAGGVSNQLVTKSMKESKAIKDFYFGKKLSHIYEYYYYLVLYKTILFLKKIIYK